MSHRDGSQDLGEYLRDMLAEEEDAAPEPAAEPSAPVEPAPAESASVEPSSEKSGPVESARVESGREAAGAGQAAASPEAEAPRAPAPGGAAPREVAWWGMTVAHLTLAIPGEAVESVEAWREPEPLPEMPDWLVGQLQVGGALRWAVDPAGLILPAEHSGKLGEVGQRAGGLLHLVDTGLSLVSASMPEPVSVPTEQVRWRREKGERPWMAGTLREQGLVLVDPSGLIETTGL